MIVTTKEDVITIAMSSGEGHWLLQDIEAAMAQGHMSRIEASNLAEALRRSVSDRKAARDRSGAVTVDLPARARR